MVQKPTAKTATADLLELLELQHSRVRPCRVHVEYAHTNRPDAQSVQHVMWTDI